MGMYDNIRGFVRCPYCGAINEIDEQIKFTNDPFLMTYVAGDKIDAPAGEYTYLSGVRDARIDCCNNCTKSFQYKIVIKNGRFSHIEPVREGITEEEINNVKKFLEEKRDLYLKSFCPALCKNN